MGKYHPDELIHQWELFKKDPEKYLELTLLVIADDPNNDNHYFSLHLVLEKLGRLDESHKALDRAFELGEAQKWSRYQARGDLFLKEGRYQDAINAYNEAERGAPIEDWRTGLGPLFRAYCYAQIGDLEAALRDCETLPEDHFTGGFWGRIPGGNKQQVIMAITQYACAARDASRRDT